MKALPACETAAASEPVAAVSFPQGSRWFAPLDATASLRSYPRGQARWGQDWRGAGNIGRWCGASTMGQVAEAWTLTAVLGRWPADRLGRSSQGLSCHQWLEWELEASGSAGGILPARAEIRPGSQTGRFRSRWHGEVATTGLLIDERAQARARIEDQHCRRGYAQTLGRIVVLLAGKIR
jgi:hypothetical protein